MSDGFGRAGGRRRRVPVRPQQSREPPEQLRVVADEEGLLEHLQGSPSGRGLPPLRAGPVANSATAFGKSARSGRTPRAPGAYVVATAARERGRAVRQIRQSARRAGTSRGL